MTECVLPLTQSREENKKQMEGINSSIILQTDHLLPTPSLLYSYIKTKIIHLWSGESPPSGTIKQSLIYYPIFIVYLCQNIVKVV